MHDTDFVPTRKDADDPLVANGHPFIALPAGNAMVMRKCDFHTTLDKRRRKVDAGAEVSVDHLPPYLRAVFVAIGERTIENVVLFDVREELVGPVCGVIFMIVSGKSVGVFGAWSRGGAVAGVAA